MSNKNTVGSSKEVFASEPRVYELGYLVMPSLSEGDLGNKRDALVALITRYEGIVVDEGQPVLIDLAYEMDKVIKNKRQKYQQAFFGWIKFDLVPEAIEALTKEIDAEEELIRSIVIKTVRENTLTSEQPFRLAKSVRGANEEDEDEEGFGEADMVVDPDDIDDLTKIEGIGPVIAQTLVDAGIITFAALADAEDDEVTEIIKEVRGNHDTKTWNEQAALARDGKWDELKELQENLNGGRE